MNYSIKQWQAVEAKMKKAGKWSMVDALNSAKEGAYYGIEVITEFGKLGTYYIAEKAWA